MNEDDLAMSYAARLTAVADSIPIAMLKDIHNRLSDWALSGESMSADYVLHLVQNAERIAAAMNNGGTEDERTA